MTRWRFFCQHADKCPPDQLGFTSVSTVITSSRRHPMKHQLGETDLNCLMRIVRPQFDLAVGLMQREIQLQRCMEERKLIADSLDSLPLSIFVLDRDRRYIFQNASDRENIH